jgi:hypothetical protein
VRRGAAIGDRRRGGRRPRGRAGQLLLAEDARRPGIQRGVLRQLIYNQHADSDIASFTLQLDNGEEFLLLVYVQGDGTVCDFI